MALLHRLWYPQIQLTFRWFDPKTKESIWKSVNVDNFKTPAPPTGGAKYDKRSCRSDQFSILLNPAKPDTYTVSAKYNDSIQVQFTVERCPRAPGWKIGSDPRGGLTYFGAQTGKPSASPDLTAGYDGYVVHRFWPRCTVKGTVIHKGAAKDLSGGRAIFIHAIQGMRPNLIASRWNFANFQTVPSSPDGEDPDGVSLTLMELTTVAGMGYGAPSKVTVGSVVVNDRLVAVVAGPKMIPTVEAEATHQEPLILDPETEYRAPSSIKYDWQGPSLLAVPDGTAAVANALPATKAELIFQAADEQAKDGSYTTNGLIEKVDVMAQIPYLVKKVIAAVAGARPYIYTVRAAPIFAFVGVDADVWVSLAVVEPGDCHDPVP